MCVCVHIRQQSLTGWNLNVDLSLLSGFATAMTPRARVCDDEPRTSAVSTSCPRYIHDRVDRFLHTDQ